MAGNRLCRQAAPSDAFVLYLQNLILRRLVFSRYSPETVEFGIGGYTSVPGHRGHSIDVKLRHDTIVKGGCDDELERQLMTLEQRVELSSGLRIASDKSRYLSSTNFGSRTGMPPASEICNWITRLMATFIHRSRQTSHSASTMSLASKVSCRPRGLMSFKTSRLRSWYCARSSLARISGLRNVVRDRSLFATCSDSRNLRIGSLEARYSDRFDQKWGPKAKPTLKRSAPAYNYRLYKDSCRTWRNEAKNSKCFQLFDRMRMDGDRAEPERGERARHFLLHRGGLRQPRTKSGRRR